ncbi:glycosyltransferase [Chitiniphilus shinanonensis]|uniref:glycosyltransferase n=1 Tax=Chitiniphilus shinanonensis TaxID=553088 RepID=UPI0030518271
MTTTARPDVTVAVMSYNNARYIGQTIESVLAQTGVSFELLVFDDQSTDDTLEVLARYRDHPNFRYEVNPQHLGAIGNYNRCVEAGSGRYVVVLGSDEVIHPDHLTSLFAALELHPEAALAYTQCSWINEHGETVRHAAHPGHLPHSYFGHRDEVVDLLSFGNYIEPPAVMLRRSVFDAVRLPDGSLRRPDLEAGDWELWTRIARKYPDFVFLRQSTVGRRVQAGEEAQSASASERLLTEHTEILESNLTDPERAKRLSAAGARIWHHYQQRLSSGSGMDQEELRARAAAIREVLCVPLVSVCISSYNHAAYIGECLESVLAQSYPNVEIVVVDDASPDETATIIRYYAERHPDRLRLIALEENLGPTRAPNLAFQAARGEFIALLGSDDRMLPDRLAKQVEYLLHHPDTVAVFTEVSPIDEHGEPAPHLAQIDALFNQPIYHLRRQLLAGNMLNAPSAMIRAADLHALGGYSPLLRYVQDYDLWVRLLLRGELARLPERLTDYRVHGRNLSVFGSEGPSFQTRIETVAVMTRAAQQWPLERLLPVECTSPAQRAAALLELARMFEQADQNFFQRPMMATATAYELALRASEHDVAQAAPYKHELEMRLGGGETQVEVAPDPVESKPGKDQQYARWLAEQRLTRAEAQHFDARMQTWRKQPLITAVVLDLAGSIRQVVDTLNSLSEQLYKPASIVILSRNPAPSGNQSDRVLWLQVGDDWAEQLNEVARQLPCDWLFLLHGGDRLEPSALLLLAEGIDEFEALTCCYLDEDAIDGDGGFGEPVFKPDFNLDLLRSMPYVGSAFAIQRDCLLELGGWPTHLGEAGHLELLFRVVEEKGLHTIGHLDHLLHHAAQSFGQWLARPDIAEATMRATSAHLERLGIAHEIRQGAAPGLQRVLYQHSAQPLVSIIVPTKDQLPMLRRCIESLMEKTTYPNYELIVVDNGSETPAAQAYLDGLESLGSERIRVLRYPYPFNYSAMNNAAVGIARGEYLLLLNNDTAVFQPDWLEALLNHAQRPEVGVVGAKLHFPDGCIQHAGVVVGLRGPADHPGVGMPADALGYMFRFAVDQNYPVVTAACLMIRKEVYQAVGGLDEQDFVVAFNDVDLCLKVRAQGYFTVWTPYAALLHEGSVSQRMIDPDKLEAKRKRLEREGDAMYRKWWSVIAHDPAYNRNMTLSGNGFEVETRSLLTHRPISWPAAPRVLAHPGDQMGCGHYRVLQPYIAMYDALLIDGAVSFELLPPFELAKFGADSIILQRQNSELQVEFIRHMRRNTPCFLVYELDDYLPNLPMKSLHRDAMPKDVLKQMRKALSYVDRFVVSTAPLAEAYRELQLHSDIRVIENRLPVGWWDGVQSKRRGGAKPRVGWGGGASHTGDLELIADVVKELANEVEWVFFGMCPDKLRPYVHEFHPGVPIEQYPAKLASLDLDLALAPLEHNLFNECKSNLRLLEYGICGFPVVATDIVCYRSGLPGVTLVKNRFRDWIDAIRAHLADLDSSARLGDELRDTVRREWMLRGENLERWRKAWLPD